ncbi:MAG: hypothetical protein ACRC1G_16685 [Bradyrhizobium sp.]|nr:hypothetical protein [Bradyrhizobium sp.]
MRKPFHSPAPPSRFHHPAVLVSLSLLLALVMLAARIIGHW